MACEEAERGASAPVDTFAQVNTALIDHGCLKKPLDMSDVPSATKKALAELLLAMIAQRQTDACFREQLSSKLRVNESSLERTKRFWKEEQDKSADLACKLETSKARGSTAMQELNECQSSLRRTKEELQKAKRDLLTVKQQAHQQKQANERQLERLRSRFSDESIKSLRAKVPEVYFANAKKSAQSFSSVASSGLERKQVEELEGKRRNLLESNAAMKRMATESLNLAREAARYLERIEGAGNEKAGAALGSSSSSSSTSGGGNNASCPLFYQRDLFPSQSPLLSDYASHSTGGPGKKQHPAVEALHQMSELIHTRGSRLVQSLSAARAGGPTLVGPEEDLVMQKARREDATREKQLIKALQRVQELEAEQSMAAAIQNQKKDGEDRIKQMAEVEKQRQRYLALCRELQTQEELLRREREALERDKEEVLKMEMSMSVQEDSHLSLDHPIKRSREEEKENEAIPKRLRVEQPSPREDTMRFVTVRKQRRVP